MQSVRAENRLQQQGKNLELSTPRRNKYQQQAPGQGKGCGRAVGAEDQLKAAGAERTVSFLQKELGPWVGGVPMSCLLIPWGVGVPKDP